MEKDRFSLAVAGMLTWLAIESLPCVSPLPCFVAKDQNKCQLWALTLKSWFNDHLFLVNVQLFHGQMLFLSR
jgi:hypothetical protein